MQTLLNFLNNGWMLNVHYTQILFILHNQMYCVCPFMPLTFVAFNLYFTIKTTFTQQRMCPCHEKIQDTVRSLPFQTSPSPTLVTVCTCTGQRVSITRCCHSRRCCWGSTPPISVCLTWVLVPRISESSHWHWW